MVAGSNPVSPTRSEDVLVLPSTVIWDQFGIESRLGNSNRGSARSGSTNPRVGTWYPGEAGMTKAVSRQVLISERSDYIVPMGSPPKPGR